MQWSCPISKEMEHDIEQTIGWKEQKEDVQEQQSRILEHKS